MNDQEALRDLVLAPYIIKATALIGVSRKVGGNQFRHCFSTLGILFDYKYFQDSILLKASVLHDLLEDVPTTELDQIRCIEYEATQVVDLVLEVTRRAGEDKPAYLKRILDHGSTYAKILKCADRISNLTDLHRDTHSDQKISDYLDQTQQYILPMAEQVNKDMVIELTDLVARRRKLLQLAEESIRVNTPSA